MELDVDNSAVGMDLRTQFHRLLVEAVVQICAMEVPEGGSLSLRRLDEVQRGDVLSFPADHVAPPGARGVLGAGLFEAPVTEKA